METIEKIKTICLQYGLISLFGAFVIGLSSTPLKSTDGMFSRIGYMGYSISGWLGVLSICLFLILGVFSLVTAIRGGSAGNKP